MRKQRPLADYDLASELQVYRLDNPGENKTANLFLEFIESTPAYLLREYPHGHVTGSAFVIDDRCRETLLVHHRKLLLWVQPGGHADGNPDIPAVADQELQEETGLSRYTRVGSSIFDIDRHTIPARGGVPEHYHYDVRFLFRATRDHKLVVSDESIDLKWFDLAAIVQGEVPERGDSIDESVQRMARKALGYE